MALERQEGGGIVRSYIIILYRSPLWPLLRPAVYFKLCRPAVNFKFCPQQVICCTCKGHDAMHVISRAPALGVK